MKKTDRSVIKSTYIDFIINRVNPVYVTFNYFIAKTQFWHLSYMLEMSFVDYVAQFPMGTYQIWVFKDQLKNL